MEVRNQHTQFRCWRSSFFIVDASSIQRRGSPFPPVIALPAFWMITIRMTLYSAVGAFPKCALSVVPYRQCNHHVQDHDLFAARCAGGCLNVISRLVANRATA